MFTYPAYKAIKAILTPAAPCFWYLGQYMKNSDNTLYIVPAIYIEMPKAGPLVAWGRKVKSIKPAVINIHYISHAPFKATDGNIQDSLVAAHEAKLVEIDTLLEGKALTNTDGTLLTQALISTNINNCNYMGNNMYSIISYKTEIYSYHLKT